jgi:hypothetical protein
MSDYSTSPTWIGDLWRADFLKMIEKAVADQPAPEERQRRLEDLRKEVLSVPAGVEHLVWEGIEAAVTAGHINSDEAARLREPQA